MTSFDIEDVDGRLRLVLRPPRTRRARVLATLVMLPAIVVGVGVSAAIVSAARGLDTLAAVIVLAFGGLFFVAHVAVTMVPGFYFSGEEIVTVAGPHLTVERRSFGRRTVLPAAKVDLRRFTDRLVDVRTFKRDEKSEMYRPAFGARLLVRRGKLSAASFGVGLTIHEALILKRAVDEYLGSHPETDPNRYRMVV